eukprot:Filipodium_phascolosomae@DN5827_c0_g1_i1.p1
MEPTTLSMVHLLPYEKRSQQCEENLKAVLHKQLGRKLAVGDSLKGTDGIMWYIVEAKPKSGTFSNDTLFFTEGDVIAPVRKAQVMALQRATGSNPTPSSDLFNQFLKPFLIHHPGHVFRLNHVFPIKSVDFCVSAMEPSKEFGVFLNQTEIFVEWDKRPEFKKVDVCPFRR